MVSRWVRLRHELQKYNTKLSLVPACFDLGFKCEIRDDNSADTPVPDLVKVIDW